MNLLLALLLAAPEAPVPILKAPVDTAHLPRATKPAGPTRPVPATPVQRLISYMDYPAAALRAGEQGVVHVALDISAEGRVTGCTITASSRSAILDATTCRLLRARARFIPARDAAGKPAADRFETQIAWTMNTSPPPPVPPAIHAAMTAWSECIGPTLANGVGNTALPARALAEQAFLPCRAQEDRMHAAIAGAMKAPHDVEKQRTAVREKVIARIEAARARN